jgi:hypothetical protein
MRFDGCGISGCRRVRRLIVVKVSTACDIQWQFALKKTRVDDGIRHEILGHVHGPSMEDRVYLEGLTYTLAELREGRRKREPAGEGRAIPSRLKGQSHGHASP